MVTLIGPTSSALTTSAQVSMQSKGLHFQLPASHQNFKRRIRAALVQIGRILKPPGAEDDLLRKNVIP